MVRYCEPSYLPLTLGGLFAVNKLAAFFGSGFSVSIYNFAGGSISGVFWSGVVVCVVSFVASIMFAIIPAKEVSRFSVEKEGLIKKSNHDIRTTDSWSLILTPFVCWYLVIGAVLGGCWIPFIQLSRLAFSANRKILLPSNMISELYELDAQSASWIASSLFAFPVILNPVIGLFLGRFQSRTLFSILFLYRYLNQNPSYF